MLNKPHGREQGRRFRMVWRAAPNTNMYRHVQFSFLFSEEAKYNHSISSQQPTAHHKMASYPLLHMRNGQDSSPPPPPDHPQQTPRPAGTGGQAQGQGSRQTRPDNRNCTNCTSSQLRTDVEAGADLGGWRPSGRLCAPNAHPI